jgi:peptidoglycan/xylan/chitin deacetylase (PgdA/CDA1 family)
LIESIEREFEAALTIVLRFRQAAATHVHLEGVQDELGHGEVVLTFDDGPVPKYTRPILAALKARCTKANFFSVGEMAAQSDVIKLKFPLAVSKIRLGP